MRDLDIRRALHRELAERHRGEPDTKCLDELGLQHGAVFVDVAVVNGALHGYEIKSGRDTLDRLPGQQKAYGSVLDFATLVAEPRHLDTASKMLPSWWGLARAHDSEIEVLLEEVRPAKRNPSAEPLAIAKLLWRDEALNLLEVHGAARGMRSKPRAAMYRRLVEVLSIDDLRAAIRARLKTREGWRVAASRT